MKKHFVVFYSPGTFVAEQTTKEIDSWDINKAIEMSSDIKERYNAIHYAFVFITRENDGTKLDSKEIKRSNLYYLGGKIITLKQLKDENLPNNKTLIQNMERNNWDKVIQTTKGWEWTQPLRDTDVVLSI